MRAASCLVIRQLFTRTSSSSRICNSTCPISSVLRHVPKLVQVCFYRYEEKLTELDPINRRSFFLSRNWGPCICGSSGFQVNKNAIHLQPPVKVRLVRLSLEWLLIPGVVSLSLFCIRLAASCSFFIRASHRHLRLFNFIGSAHRIFFFGFAYTIKKLSINELQIGIRGLGMRGIQNKCLGGKLGLVIF